MTSSSTYFPEKDITSSFLIAEKICTWMYLVLSSVAGDLGCSHYTAQRRELFQVLPQQHRIGKKPSLLSSFSANKSWYWPRFDTGCRPSCPGQKQERLPPLPQQLYFGQFCAQHASLEHFVPKVINKEEVISQALAHLITTPLSQN